MKTSFLRILFPVLFAGLASLALLPDADALVLVATNSARGLACTDTATSEREGSAPASFSVSASLLRPGINVLCVQAFNRTLTNDDFRIDLELVQTPPVRHHVSGITRGPDQTMTLGLDGSALGCS